MTDPSLLLAAGAEPASIRSAAHVARADVAAVPADRVAAGQSIL